ncbi:MAG: CYTH domain-containing protein [Solirubrobacterales bacterium]
MEIERKFTVAERPEFDPGDGEPIEQGYLAIGHDEVRLRKKGDRRLLTVKRGSGLSREEREVELDDEQFEALWSATGGRRLRKRRYVIPHDGLEIELDVYEGDLEGLTVAEVEFESEQQADGFVPPDWFGEEVTGEEAYLNRSLATRGTEG